MAEKPSLKRALILAGVVGAALGLVATKSPSGALMGGLFFVALALMIWGIFVAPVLFLRKQLPKRQSQPSDDRSHELEPFQEPAQPRLSEDELRAELREELRKEIKKEARAEAKKASINSAGSQQGCGCLLLVISIPLLICAPPIGIAVLIAALVILIIGFIPR